MQNKTGLQKCLKHMSKGKKYEPNSSQSTQLNNNHRSVNLTNVTS